MRLPSRLPSWGPRLLLGLVLLAGAAASVPRAAAHPNPPSKPPDPEAAAVSGVAPASPGVPPAPAAAVPKGDAAGDSKTCTNDGDVSGDGIISAGDAQQAFYIALGALTPTPTEYCAADCNGDGTVSAGDAQLIFYMALGSGHCVDQPSPSLFVTGAGHVRATSSSGLRLRIGFGLLTPVGTSPPGGEGHTVDFGVFPMVKDF